MRWIPATLIICAHLVLVLSLFHIAVKGYDLQTAQTLVQVFGCCWFSPHKPSSHPLWYIFISFSSLPVNTSSVTRKCFTLVSKHIFKTCLCIYRRRPTGLFVHVCLVEIARNLTLTPCHLSRIEAAATARLHLICRPVPLLLPRNAQDRSSFVNWIGTLPVEPD